MLKPYKIRFSHQQKPAFMIDACTVDDTNTSLTLPGKGYVDYGQLYNENLVHLLENFCSNIPPSNPTQGQLWFNMVDRKLYFWTHGPGSDKDPTLVKNWFMFMSYDECNMINIPVIDYDELRDLEANCDARYGSMTYVKRRDGNCCPSGEQDDGITGTLYVYDGCGWSPIALQKWADCSFRELLDSDAVYGSIYRWWHRPDDDDSMKAGGKYLAYKLIKQYDEACIRTYLEGRLAEIRSEFEQEIRELNRKLLECCPALEEDGEEEEEGEGEGF